MSQDVRTALTPEILDHLRSLRGVVATVVLGQVEADFAQARENLRAWCVENDFRAIEWITQPAQLVEAGRDSVCAHALRENYDWLLMVDADAAPIPPDALLKILHDAYVAVPDADAVGAYCQLKGGLNLPSIDTGTGTWEPHFPGEGLLPVIRTGAHFLLVKTAILRRFGPPWFRTRLTKRPIDAFAEIDNYARMKLDGRNPFASSPEWGELTQIAKEESNAAPSSVGEDSGFSDALHAAGGHLYVDTDLVIGHVERRSILPADLKRNLDDHDRRIRLACGVLS